MGLCLSQWCLMDLETLVVEFCAILRSWSRTAPSILLRWTLDSP